MREMLVDQKDVFYYLTMMNENYAQPSLPPEAHAQVIAGCYKFGSYLPANLAGYSTETLKKVTLMGSGAILTEVIKAAALLAAQGVASDVISVTSWSELAREGMACEKADGGLVAVSGDASVAVPFVTRQLGGAQGPVIAATDYVRAVPESIRAFVPQERRYVTLGTDGFGRSDTRAALRAFFEVDAGSIVRAALGALEQLPTC